MDSGSLDNLYAKARGLLDLGRPREALPLFLKVSAQDPNNYAAIVSSAVCHLHLEEYKNALEYAEKAIALSPEDEWGHRVRSITLGNLDRKNEALEEALEAVRLAPELPEAHNTLVRARLRCNDVKGAQEAAKGLIVLAPADTETWLLAGVVEIAADNKYTAEKYLKKALEIDPLSAQARNALGMLAMRADGKSKEAIEHIEAAVRLDPTNTWGAESLYSEMSALPVMLVYLLLLPIILIGFVISPLYSLVFLVVAIYTIIKTFVTNAMNRRKLSNEMRMLFRSKGIGERMDDVKGALKATAANVFEKLWLAYVLAFAALVIRIVSISTNTKPLYYLSWIIFFAGTLVIYKKLD